MNASVYSPKSCCSCAFLLSKVLFGRGGGINKHPGNVRFREHALELWPWYTISTKEEKQNIAELLVEGVRNNGHRFLAIGKDGLWHEVIYGYHTKASQTFRDLEKHASK